MEGYIVVGWIGMFFFVALASGMIVYNFEPREPVKAVLCGVLAIICLSIGVFCFFEAQAMRHTPGRSVMTIEQGKTE